MKSLQYKCALLLILLTSVFQVNSAALIVDAATLLGANGVDVDGVLYDVRFKDSTLEDVFINGDGSTAFDATTLAQAQAFSSALRSQVLIDTAVDGPWYTFDGSPQLTFGCSYLVLCDIYTPYEISLDYPALITSSVFRNSWRFSATDDIHAPVASLRYLSFAPPRKSWRESGYGRLE